MTKYLYHSTLESSTLTTSFCYRKQNHSNAIHKLLLQEASCTLFVFVFYEKYWYWLILADISSYEKLKARNLSGLFVFGNFWSKIRVLKLQQKLWEVGKSLVWKRIRIRILISEFWLLISEGENVRFRGKSQNSDFFLNWIQWLHCMAQTATGQSLSQAPIFNLVLCSKWEWSEKLIYGTGPFLQGRRCDCSLLWWWAKPKCEVLRLKVYLCFVYDILSRTGKTRQVYLCCE